MEYLSGFLSGELISAVALTILHSFWQALLIAFLCWLILLFVKKENAQGRYLIYISGIISVFIMSVFTFISIYKPVLSDTTGLSIGGADILIGQVIFKSHSAASNVNLEQLVSNLSPYISTLWAIGCLVFILRFAGGIFYNIRMRNEGLLEVSGVWTDRVKKLSKKINTKKTIKLYESIKVKVPTVIGHLKPVILFPAGVISGIPTKQIEAILAHEIAHIKRYDYLINLIQSIMEIIFFYHPAFWWLNTRAKSERENCCDDIAMKSTGDRLMYARALSNIQEVSQGNLNLSPAFSSRKGKLLSRIQRLYNRSYEKVGSGKFSTITGLMLLVAFVALFSAGVQSSVGQEKPEPQNVENGKIFSGNEAIKLESDANVSNNTTLLASSIPAIIPQDKVDKSKRKINIKGVEVDGKKYDVYLVLKDEEVLEFKLDGETIAKEDYDKYDKIIKAAIKEFDKRMAEMELKLKEMSVKMENLQEELAEKQEEMHKILEEIDENIYKEHLDLNLERIQEELQRSQELMHERLRHIDKGALRHIDDNLHKSIEDINFDYELDSGRERLKEMYEHMDFEEFFDSDELKRMNREIIDEIKQFNLKDIDRYLNQENVNKIQRNIRRNLENFNFNFENHNDELQNRLRHLFEDESLNQEEIHLRMQEEMEHLNSIQNEIQNEMHMEMEKMHENLVERTEEIEEMYDAGEISEEEMEKMIQKETKAIQSKVRKNEDEMRLLMEKRNKEIQLRGKELQNQLESRMMDWHNKEQELIRRMDEGQRNRKNEVRRIEERLRDHQRGQMDRNLSRLGEKEDRLRMVEREMINYEHRTEELITVIKSELQEDDIIDDDLKSFHLTKKHLKVNGKKQSKKMYEKYLNLYENISGKELKKEFKIMLDN